METNQFASTSLEYGQRLAHEARRCLGEDWSFKWSIPKWSDGQAQIHHSRHWAVHTIDKLLYLVQEDNANDHHSFCIIEDIPFDWAIQLGWSWNIDPMYFIRHVEPLNRKLTERALEEPQNPGVAGSLQSERGGASWATMKGVIDFGQSNQLIREVIVKQCVTAAEFSPRQAEESQDGRYMCHTNISSCRVSEQTDLLLVDRIPEYQYRFIVRDPDRVFPFETVTRIALLETPGHIAFPRLMDTNMGSVLPLRTMLYDRVNNEELVECLQEYCVDDFLYKASVHECRNHLREISKDVDHISYQEVRHGGEDVVERLHDVREDLYHLRKCIIENRIHEEAFIAARRPPRASSRCERAYFSKLEADVSALANELSQAFKALTATVNNKDRSEGLRQSERMTTLTGLAFAYAPLSFVASLFGMNIKEINGSRTALRYFFAWLIGIVVVTSAIAGSYGLWLRHRKHKLRVRRPERPWNQPAESSPASRSNAARARSVAARLRDSFPLTRRSKIEGHEMV